jgi:hypothetical protein
MPRTRRRKRRKPGAQCCCINPEHRHIGQCMNRVWGHNGAGHLYRFCDDCRLSLEDRTNPDLPPIRHTATVGPEDRADSPIDAR